ncbi:putative NAD-dependent DNA ligase OB-fold domain containing protein [Neospora caninum Liverpool]|uniref:NAD-dependent DNA ligase OB-fold domain containing protein, putative n=1 Tax=Neospora caninum (strain Liverpool) TaxID=572307 RepID=F0VNR2_NEOCL|nr:putative NAD-dependent DNA ligase OB-fold domain containing protein [Neospora caninum Liverpool]CBZ55358.1 putative NAD-dependent DNA ligase OB-fold domain containing protein [Neospora caninum Liverpool]CEL70094.1 TPA: NAD-dependent DNA ligase OB-fold domain containing protein, putative [Neospora caninum Liverpool]|eukprot:XP_003885386.1 putative NAD-dependent DNA ligase OB-fold domain containing protein [Neospora caninum Liverpool]
MGKGASPSFSSLSPLHSSGGKASSPSRSFSLCLPFCSSLPWRPLASLCVSKQRCFPVSRVYLPSCSPLAPRLSPSYSPSLSHSLSSSLSVSSSFSLSLASHLNPARASPSPRLSFSQPHLLVFSRRRQRCLRHPAPCLHPTRTLSASLAAAASDQSPRSQPANNAHRNDLSRVFCDSARDGEADLREKTEAGTAHRHGGEPPVDVESEGDSCLIAKSRHSPRSLTGPIRDEAARRETSRGAGGRENETRARTARGVEPKRRGSSRHGDALKEDCTVSPLPDPSEKEEYHKLVETLRACDRAYHVGAHSPLPDAVYDQLKARLLHLEEVHPSLVTPESPSSYVGAGPFASVTSPRGRASACNTSPASFPTSSSLSPTSSAPSPRSSSVSPSSSPLSFPSSPLAPHAHPSSSPRSAPSRVRERNGKVERGETRSEEVIPTCKDAEPRIIFGARGRKRIYHLAPMLSLTVVKEGDCDKHLVHAVAQTCKPLGLRWPLREETKGKKKKETERRTACPTGAANPAATSSFGPVSRRAACPSTAAFPESSPAPCAPVSVSSPSRPASDSPSTGAPVTPQLALPLAFLAEPKIDGISCALRFKGRLLDSAPPSPSRSTPVSDANVVDVTASSSGSLFPFPGSLGSPTRHTTAAACASPSHSPSAPRPPLQGSGASPLPRDASHSSSSCGFPSSASLASFAGSRPARFSSRVLWELVDASPRGNGSWGEDISHSVRVMHQAGRLPVAFSTRLLTSQPLAPGALANQFLEIRGELFLPRSNFQDYVERRRKEGKNTPLHERHAARGIADTGEHADLLCFAAYGLVESAEVASDTTEIDSERSPDKASSPVLVAPHDSRPPPGVRTAGADALAAAPFRDPVLSLEVKDADSAQRAADSDSRLARKHQHSEESIGDRQRHGGEETKHERRVVHTLATQDDLLFFLERLGFSTFRDKTRVCTTVEEMHSAFAFFHTHVTAETVNGDQNENARPQVGHAETADATHSLPSAKACAHGEPQSCSSSAPPLAFPSSSLSSLTSLASASSARSSSPSSGTSFSGGAFPVSSSTSFPPLSDVPADGVVFKVLSLPAQLLLGNRATGPRWAFARKFPQPFALSRIRDFAFSVGQFGYVHVVAALEPVRLGNLTISRASVGTIETLARRGLAVGDEVYVHLSGHTTPLIVGIQEALGVSAETGSNGAERKRSKDRNEASATPRSGVDASFPANCGGGKFEVTPAAQRRAGGAAVADRSEGRLRGRSLLAGEDSRLLAGEDSRLLAGEDSRLLAGEDSRLLAGEDSRLLAGEDSRLLAGVSAQQTQCVDSRQTPCGVFATQPGPFAASLAANAPLAPEAPGADDRTGSKLPAAPEPSNVSCPSCGSALVFVPAPQPQGKARESDSIQLTPSSSSSPLRCSSPPPPFPSPSPSRTSASTSVFDAGRFRCARGRACPGQVSRLLLRLLDRACLNVRAPPTTFFFHLHASGLLLRPSDFLRLCFLYHEKRHLIFASTPAETPKAGNRLRRDTRKNDPGLGKSPTDACPADGPFPTHARQGEASASSSRSPADFRASPQGCLFREHAEGEHAPAPRTRTRRAKAGEDQIEKLPSLFDVCRPQSDSNRPPPVFLRGSELDDPRIIPKVLGLTSPSAGRSPSPNARLPPSALLAAPRLILGEKLGKGDSAGAECLGEGKTRRGCRSGIPLLRGWESLVKRVVDRCEEGVPLHTLIFALSVERLGLRASKQVAQACGETVEGLLHFLRWLRDALEKGENDGEEDGSGERKQGPREGTGDREASEGRGEAERQHIRKEGHTLRGMDDGVPRGFSAPVASSLKSGEASFPPSGSSFSSSLPASACSLATLLHSDPQSSFSPSAFLRSLPETPEEMKVAFLSLPETLRSRLSFVFADDENVRELLLLAAYCRGNCKQPLPHPLAPGVSAVSLRAALCSPASPASQAKFPTAPSPAFSNASVSSLSPRETSHLPPPARDRNAAPIGESERIC